MIGGIEVPNEASYLCRQRLIENINAATRVRERSLAALPMLRVERSVESLTFKSRPAPAREPETNEKCGRDGEH
jgi:hypothetical protein